MSGIESRYALRCTDTGTPLDLGHQVDKVDFVACTDSALLQEGAPLEKAQCPALVLVKRSVPRALPGDHDEPQDQDRVDACAQMLGRASGRAAPDPHQ